jgi:hypothetical protein
MIALIKSNPAYKKCEIWICGDFNLDFLNLEQHGPTKLHYESMLARNFLPVITRPTRVTAHSATLIDHIFVENAAKTQITGVIIQELADHYPMFNIEPGTRGAKSLPYLRRDFNDESNSAFKKLLESSFWETVTNENDPKTSFDNFFFNPRGNSGPSVP